MEELVTQTKILLRNPLIKGEKKRVLSNFLKTIPYIHKWNFREEKNYWARIISEVQESVEC